MKLIFQTQPLEIFCCICCSCCMCNGSSLLCSLQKWSNEAAANAQKWANTCSMNHSPASSRTISTSGCGENLYISSFKNTWSNVIQAWYDEVADFQYGVGSTNGGVVGHYTQVVWYRSNLVGCALARCPNAQYEYFYVCQYCPP
uniref:Cysteine rich secretory protein 3 n=1 Tax=Sparus aurata TaxID=8175 RepID=A0A671VPG8_SPAAU